MSQFDVDLGLFKRLEPAARPIDTFSPVRIKAPDAGSQLRELAAGLSTFNQGLTKFALEEKEEFDEKERLLGEAEAAELSAEERRKIAINGIRQAEKDGLIPEGYSPARLIAIQEAVGREIAQDYEKRAFSLVQRLSDPTNNENIEEAFKGEWEKTQLGDQSFYITASALKARAEIDNRLERQVYAQRAVNTVSLNKEQHSDKLTSDLDDLDTLKSDYTPEFFENHMNDGKTQFNHSFFQETYERVSAEAISLAQQGDKERAMLLIEAFSQANPSGQKNADMGRKFGIELKELQRKVELADRDFEAAERSRNAQKEAEAGREEARLKRERDAVVNRIWARTDFTQLTRREAEEVVRSGFEEAGIAPEQVGDYIRNDFPTDYSKSQDSTIEREEGLLLGNAGSQAELDALIEELKPSRAVVAAAQSGLERNLLNQSDRIRGRTSDSRRLWLNLVESGLEGSVGTLSTEIFNEESQRFDDAVSDIIEEIQEENQNISPLDLGNEVQRRIREWVTENKSRILNEQDVNSVVSRIRADEFVLPQIGELPPEPSDEEFAGEGPLEGLFAGRLGNRVGDYFDQTTSKAREDYARENVQPIIQEELKAADFQIRKITRGFTRPATSLTPATPVPGRELDQNGIDARRYRSAVLFTGVSIEDLERGSFENGVTIVDDLRKPKMTPFFPNKKALEDALDEYDNAAPEAQSGTLIGRLIAELGAENTGTADDFATMQGLLLQRRGMN